MSEVSEQILEQCWSELQEHFSMSSSETQPIKPATLELLVKEDLCKFVEEYFWEELLFQLRDNIVPKFWKAFNTIGSTADSKSGFEKFHRAVLDLYVSISATIPYIQKLEALGQERSKRNGKSLGEYGESCYADLYKLFLKGTLHSQLPQDFQVIVSAFYNTAFQVFYFRKDKDLNHDEDLDDSADDIGSLECGGCKNDSENFCECNSIIAIFHDVNQKLLELDILERLTSDVVTKIVHARIESHVQETCKGSFIVSHIHALENWMHTVVMGWIRLLYSSANQGFIPDVKSTSALDTFKQRLMNYLYEIYTKTRIDQLFNIIIEFPDSQPALEDLRECLTKTDLRGQLTQSLKKVLDSKLLHLGVNTLDILTAYIAAIKALRILDPSGVLLELSCESVRKYLRTRQDTVRCIVQSLIDDNSSELTEELMKKEGLCLDESLNDEDDFVNWESWQPDPVDADSSRRSRRVSDIVSMLVNIYGSKELFVQEYRDLLSNRLLAQFKYETDKEIRNLELLKLRFGDSPLHQCEVMLKDIGDSKRINSHLHSDDGSKELDRQPFFVNAIILSAQFWPPFKQETLGLQLPAEVEDALAVYTKSFEALKGNRTLVWKTNLGQVNLDLEIGEKHVNLWVTPVHAAIIYQFQEKSEWTADELAAALKVPVSTLRRRIAFWQTQGLIKETAIDRFALIEEGPMRRMSGLAGSTEDEEHESVTTTSRDQRAEELQMFWSYIVAMLTNLESLPLDRIFQMLKMFAMQGPAVVECDIDELRSFLDNKVREHQLIFSGGLYKLPKT